MATENSKPNDEAQIRMLVDDQAKAVRAKDIEWSMANYVTEIVSFDVVNPLRKIGLDATNKRAQDWFSVFQGPIGYENRDLSITTGDVVAFYHSLNRINIRGLVLYYSGSSCRFHSWPALLRIEYPGALYHITSRGDRQEPIFEDDRDRTAFLNVLGDVVSRFRWQCHAC